MLGKPSPFSNIVSFLTLSLFLSFYYKLSYHYSEGFYSIPQKSFLTNPLYHHHHHRRRQLEQSTNLYSIKENTVVLLYNKPSNVITSHAQQDDRITIYDNIINNNITSFQQKTKIQSKLHSIGRLDAETTGLLLVTNDKRLVDELSNPTKTNLTKTYEAIIMGYHDNNSSMIEYLRSNKLDLGKYGITQPPKVLQVMNHPTPKSTKIQITLKQGKNRQIRRMFHAVNSGVMKLARVKIGYYFDLYKEQLKEGEWRVLSKWEVEQVLGVTVNDIEQENCHGKSGSYNKRKKRIKKRKF